MPELGFISYSVVKLHHFMVICKIPMSSRVSNIRRIFCGLINLCYNLD